MQSTTLSWAELFTKHFCFDVSRRQNLGRLNLEQNWNLTFDLFDISFKKRDYKKTTVLCAYENPVYKKIVKNVRIQFKPAANAYDVPTKSWATTGSFTILSQFNRWKCFILQSNQFQFKMVHAKVFFTKFRLYIIDQRWHNPRNFFKLWLQYPITLNTIHLKHRCSGEWFGILFEGWNQSEKLCEIKSPLAMTDALSFYRSINVLRHSKNLIAFI